MKLSQKDARQFFKITMPLLHWVNEAGNIAPALDPDQNHDMGIFHTLLAAVWKRPEYIDEYLSENDKYLPRKTKNTLSKWRKHFISGPFILERFTSDGAVFISVLDGKVYLVSGITSDIEEGVNKDFLPCVAETALVPYKGKIIYDSTMLNMPLLLDSGGITELSMYYRDAKERGRIIRTLPSPIPLEDNEQWSALLNTIMAAVSKELEHADDVEKQASLNPELHLISEADLAVLERLLRKIYRTPADWDRIQEVLFSGDVVTAQPALSSENVRCVDDVLCHNGILQVFTTIEKCRKYIRYLNEKYGLNIYYRIISLSFEAIIEIADDHKMDVWLDFSTERNRKKFVAYTSKNQRLSAMVAR